MGKLVQSQSAFHVPPIRKQRLRYGPESADIVRLELAADGVYSILFSQIYGHSQMAPRQRGATNFELVTCRATFIGTFYRGVEGEKCVKHKTQAYTHEK